MCVCVCVCVCVYTVTQIHGNSKIMVQCVSVCVYIHDNSKNNGSIYLKLEQMVVHENSSEEFDIGHCLIKVKVMV